MVEWQAIEECKHFISPFWKLYHISVFDKFIWCTIGPMTFFIGTAQFSLWAIGAANYNYIVTNSINCLLIDSIYIPNGTHTDHF